MLKGIFYIPVKNFPEQFAVCVKEEFCFRHFALMVNHGTNLVNFVMHKSFVIHKINLLYIKIVLILQLF